MKNYQDEQMEISTALYALLSLILELQLNGEYPGQSCKSGGECQRTPVHSVFTSAVLSESIRSPIQVEHRQVTLH
jgi:hypothetical protein